MKRLFLLITAISLTYTIYAQVGRWFIRPNYESIRLADNGNYVITDSAGIKTLWNLDGKRLHATQNTIMPWVEGKAVVVNNEGKVIGFYGKDAVFTPILKCTMDATHFSNGYLRVFDEGFYRFVDENGKFCPGKYKEARDFANGYASCSSYLNLAKKKDEYYLLLDTDGNEVRFEDKGKAVKVEDIMFISQVNDEDVGIVVIENKVFFFDGKTKRLTPVYAFKEETNAKNQAKLENDLEKCMTYDNLAKTYSIQAKSGKAGKIIFTFDSLDMPLSIQSDVEKVIYKKKESKEEEITSTLVVTADEGLYGLSLENGAEVLPPQFEKVMEVFDNLAFVKYEGKCGMIGVMNDERFMLVVNEGKDIGFRHKKKETTIRLLLPKDIPSKITSLEMLEEDKCELDEYKSRRGDTSYGNYVEYNCNLLFPDTLGKVMYENTKVELAYPAWVLYDGLYSPIVEAKVNAWYQIYLDARIDDKKVAKGTANFTLYIEAGNERLEDISINVNLNTSNDTSLVVTQQKRTETKYEYTIEGLKEGVQKFIVEVTEDGCPTLEYPSEINYKKTEKAVDISIDKPKIKPIIRPIPPTRPRPTTRKPSRRTRPTPPT